MNGFFNASVNFCLNFFLVLNNNKGTKIALKKKTNTVWRWKFRTHHKNKIMWLKLCTLSNTLKQNFVFHHHIILCLFVLPLCSSLVSPTLCLVFSVSLWSVFVLCRVCKILFIFYVISPSLDFIGHVNCVSEMSTNFSLNGKSLRCQ